MNNMRARREVGLLAAIALLCFGSFSWGVCRHFRRAGRTPPGMQVISAVSLAGLAVFLVELFRTKRRPAVPLAAATMLGALGLFWWAVAVSGRRRLAVAFAAGAPGAVLRSGPWQLVRHPFYSSYLMFWSATVLAVGGPAWIAALLLGVCYLVASRREERGFAGTPDAGAYAAYRRATPMFVPWHLLLRPRRLARACDRTD